jgi:hypothetical protein
MATINVTDKATPELRALMNRVKNPIPGLLIAGRAVRNLLKAHYREKDSKPNKLGGERQFFWAQVGRGVNAPQPSGQAQVVVSISHPAIYQKIKGGTITAKRHRMLTIPVRPEAYGRAASVLEDKLGVKLFLVAKGGRAFLAARLTRNRAHGAAATNSALRIFYVLKRSVTQQPDPTALPPQEQIQATAMKSFGEWVLRTGGNS